MKVFLIILAVIVLLIILILCISAEFTIIFDNGWSTKVKVLFIEKDIQLTKLLSFLVAPEKAGADAAEKSKEKKKQKDAAKVDEVAAIEDNSAEDNAEQKADEKTVNESAETPNISETVEDDASDNANEETAEMINGEEEKPKKANPVKKIYDDEGVVGILLLVSNLLQTVNSAVTTLIKGLHIYSLYVKMIIGGGDAATIGEKYGAICGWYFPLKGIIINQMRVDQYDDLIIPDFIAPRSEYEFQFIGSISVGLLVKVGLKAGAKFIVNYIKNK